MSLESRLRALQQATAPGSAEEGGLEQVINEVRYFDKNAVSQYDSAIMEKLLDLESLLLTKDTPLVDINKPQGLIDMTAAPDGSYQTAPQAPAVTDPPIKIINDLYRLVTFRHKDTARTKRGGF